MTDASQDGRVKVTFSCRYPHFIYLASFNLSIKGKYSYFDKISPKSKQNKTQSTRSTNFLMDQNAVAYKKRKVRRESYC